MKKILSIMTAAAVILSLTACSKNTKDVTIGASTAESDAASDVTDAASDVSGAVVGGENVQIPNPWTDHETAADMEAGAGFAFSAPETANGLAATAYRTMGGLAEVDYGDGDNEITLRKGEGKDDVSGVFTTYAEQKQLDVNGVAVTASGENGAYMLATWTDGGYSYSVYSAGGLTEQALTEIIEAMTDVAMGGESVQIPNPWTDHETAADMEAAGFAFSAPDMANGLAAVAYRTMDGLAEIDYGEGDNEITLRKGEGESDVSGVYTPYAEQKQLDVNGVTVTASGENGAYMLATWTDGGYSYSVYSAGGLTEQALTEIIGAMK